MQVCCYISVVAQIYLGSELQPSTTAAATAFAATAPFTPSSTIYQTLAIIIHHTKKEMSTTSNSSTLSE